MIKINIDDTICMAKYRNKFLCYICIKICANKVCRLLPVFCVDYYQYFMQYTIYNSLRTVNSY